jgi:hypothetical protein
MKKYMYISQRRWLGDINTSTAVLRTKEKRRMQLCFPVVGPPLVKITVRSLACPRGVTGAQVPEFPGSFFSLARSHYYYTPRRFLCGLHCCLVRLVSLELSSWPEISNRHGSVAERLVGAVAAPKTLAVPFLPFLGSLGPSSWLLGWTNAMAMELADRQKAVDQHHTSTEVEWRSMGWGLSTPPMFW